MKRTSVRTVYFLKYYHHYMRSKTGRKKKGTISKKGDLLPLLSTIWKTVAEHYLENDAGVYIDNIGYLCHMIRPVQIFKVDKIVGDIRRMGTNGYMYYHVALDFRDPKKYFHFVVQDYTKAQSRRKMKNGKRYRFLYNEVLAKRSLMKDFLLKVIYDPKYLVYEKRKER